MKCLEGYIGLRGSGLPEPESGVYLNDLSGITLSEFSSLNTTDQAGWADLWDSLQARAALTFNTTFKSMMGRKYRLKDYTAKYVTSATVDSTTAIQPVFNEFRGLCIDCNVPKSKFHFIPIDAVRIYLLQPAPVTIYIFGVSHGDSLNDPIWTSPPISGAGGWNRVIVNQKFYDNKQLFIAYDCTNIASASIPLDGRDFNQLGQYMGGFYGHVQVSGRRFNNNRLGNPEMEAFGLQATLGLSCDYTTLICNSREQLAMPWAYLLAAELMFERVHSNRVNSYTTINIESARELTAAYNQKFMELLELYVKGVDLQADWCIECDAQLKRLERLP